MTAIAPEKIAPMDAHNAVKNAANDCHANFKPWIAIRAGATAAVHTTCNAGRNTPVNQVMTAPNAVEIAVPIVDSTAVMPFHTD